MIFYLIFFIACILCGELVIFILCWQEPEFTDKKVQAKKPYEYRVTAENEGGESDPSEVSVPIKARPLKGNILGIKIRYYSIFSC